jgi:transposase
MCTEEAFGAVVPTDGHPAWPPWPLALGTIVPCAEGLSERQAANAVRRRLDWKYVLPLERTAPGGEASVLRAWRTRLLAGATASLLCETRHTWYGARPLVKAGGRQWTASTPMLAAVRALNRLAGGGDMGRHALTRLAVEVPAWVRAVSPPAGQDREARRAADDRLPTTPAARAALARTLGSDGWRWLAAIEHAESPPWRREGPAVVIRRRVWIPQERWDGPQRQGRAADPRPPAAPCRSSPDDAEAPDARQHTTQWGGANGPLTDTCADDLPPLITNLDPTPGPAAEGATPPESHAARPPRGLRPGTPRVDPGVRDAARRVEPQADDGVARVGSTRRAEHWPARDGTGVAGGVCPPGRDRRPERARETADTPTTPPCQRPGASPSWTHPDGGGTEGAPA